MTDGDFRDLFSRLEQRAEPRPAFVDQLLADIEAVVTRRGAIDAVPTPESAGAARARSSHDTHTYLDQKEEPAMPSFVNDRPRKTKTVVALVAAAAVAAIAVLITQSGTSHHPTTVAVTVPPHPGPLPTLDPATSSFITGLHGPYLSYHLSLDEAFNTCNPVTLDVATCRTNAQTALAAVNQLVAALSRLPAPPSLANVAPQFRAALANVASGLDRAIAAASADKPLDVRAAAGQFAGADTDLCASLTELNRLAPISEQFSQPNTTTSC